MKLVIQILVVLCLLRVSEESTSSAKPNCPRYCGSVEMMYPFGIGSNCYLDKWFEIECRADGKTNLIPKFYSENGRPSTPYLKRINLELYSITSDTILVAMPTSFKELEGTPFYFSTAENIFVGLGCNIVAYLADETENQNAIVWCASVCGSDSYPRPCEASLEENIQTRRPKFQKITTNVTINSTETFRIKDNTSCGLSLLAQKDWIDLVFSPSGTSPYCNEFSDLEIMPITLGYMIDSNLYGSNFAFDCQMPIVKYNNTIISNHSVQCFCNIGYKGNPYLPSGCVILDDQGNKFNSITIIIGLCLALGVLVLIIGGWFLFIAVKRYNSKKKKDRFFKQNGGLLLQQHMSSTDGNIDTTKVFNSYELDKATDHYNANRVLGQGGQGTVYKGMLSDGRIVAVKKSKISDLTNVEQFINEVVILSQINQRNIVKLLGCCLETEVPLLVYEFISNGTLYQHIQNPNEDFPLNWEIRLRIAIEIAGALSYLHSASSIPIYHRDIKSTNILLDDKYKTRVCDFGTSRSVDIDKTHLTTRVQGTFGYLDPEFFQSSQFTEKSDVYSFGVVLVELLTGRKPIFTSETQEIRGLAAYFLQEMEENRFFEMIDPRILDENKIKEMVEVAYIAKQCLHLNRRGRPTMKEVTCRLEGIKMWQDQSVYQGNYGVPISHETDIAEVYDGLSTSTDTWCDTNPGSSSDVFPLLK